MRGGDASPDTAAGAAAQAAGGQRSAGPQGRVPTGEGERIGDMPQRRRTPTGRGSASAGGTATPGWGSRSWCSHHGGERQYVLSFCFRSHPIIPSSFLCYPPYPTLVYFTSSPLAEGECQPAVDSTVEVSSCTSGCPSLDSAFMRLKSDSFVRIRRISHFHRVKAHSIQATIRESLLRLTQTHPRWLLVKYAGLYLFSASADSTAQDDVPGSPERPGRAQPRTRDRLRWRRACADARDAYRHPDAQAEPQQPLTAQTTSRRRYRSEHRSRDAS